MIAPKRNEDTNSVVAIDDNHQNGKSAKSRGHSPTLKSAIRPGATRRSKRKPVDAQSILLGTAKFGPWALAIVFLCVSMPHLATGFCRITGCSLLTGWLLALAIDSAQVISKLQLTIAKTLTVGKAPKATSLGIILATAGLSMTLNVLAFLEHADGEVGMILAWVAGLLLPLFILGLSYSGSAYCLAPRAAAARRGPVPARSGSTGTAKRSSRDSRSGSAPRRRTSRSDRQESGRRAA